MSGKDDDELWQEEAEVPGAQDLLKPATLEDLQLAWMEIEAKMKRMKRKMMEKIAEVRKIAMKAKTAATMVDEEVVAMKEEMAKKDVAKVEEKAK